MKGPLLRTLLVVVPLALSAAALAASSCNSTTSPVGIAQGCTINSDCASPLVCAFGRCHEACAESRDCPPGQRCVSSGTDKVCELPEDNACSSSKPCPGALVCTSDQQCRNACSTAQPCPGAQVCSSGACYEPGELDGGTDGGGNDAQSADASDAACVPSVGDAGALGYKSSNFDLGALTLVAGSSPDGGLVIVSPPSITVSGSASAAALGTNRATITLSDSSQAYLYVMSDFIVQSGAVLVLRSTQLTYPVIIASLGKVDIQGDIVANGNGLAQVAGAGGNPEYGLPAGLGPGGGGSGYSVSFPTSAAGGASFCGTGGKGSGTGSIATAGSTYPGPTLIPLPQGSAGGYGYGANGSGPGGGSIQISSRTSITVRNSGSINVGGGGSYGGGGAGGAILLEAPTLAIQGRLAANGGSGGDVEPSVTSHSGADGTANDTPAPPGGSGGTASAGAMINGGDGKVTDGGLILGAGGGGAGFIRLNSSCGATIDSAAIISPYVTTMCTSQGTLKP